MKAAGLQPAGDPAEGRQRAWTQDVPLVRFVDQGSGQAVSVTGRRDQTWTQGEQIAIRATMTGDHV
jgi:hypothetical protein